MPAKVVGKALVHRLPIWFVVGLCLLGVVLSPGTIDPAYTVRLMLLSVLMGLGALAVRSRGAWKWTPPGYALVAYAVLSVVSIVVSTNRGEALQSSAAAVLYAGWYVVLLQLVRREWLAGLSRAVTTLACLLALVALAQYFDLGFSWLPGEYQPFATMTTKNLLSSFLFLLLPFVFYAAVRESGSWQWIAFGSWALVAITLLATQTRAVWLGIAVGGAVGLLVYISARSRSATTDKAATLRPFAILALIGAASVLLAVVGHIGIRRADSTVSFATRAASIVHYTSDPSASMRLTAWKKSLEMAKDHPLLGVGAGNWKIVLPHYGLGDFPGIIQDATFTWTYPHNDFLSALTELGIGGLVAYAGIFLLALYGALRNTRAASSPEEKWLFVLLAGAVSGYAIISTFDFPSSSVAHNAFFMLLLALVSCEWGRSANTSGSTASDGASSVAVVQPIRTVPGRLAAPIVGLAAGLSVLVGAIRYTSETHQRSLLEARQLQDWDRVEAECNKAYYPHLITLDVFSTPILYYRAEAEFMQGQYSDALADNLAALREHPDEIQVLNNIASCYVNLRNFEAAKAFYKRALSISPRYEESLINLSVVYLKNGESMNARATIGLCDTNRAGSRAQQIAQAIMARTSGSHS